jgi:adenine phosphoribosyltransferase
MGGFVAVLFEKYIRDVPDFPKPGILFKDITPLLQNAGIFASTIQEMAIPYRNFKVDAIVGIESRGFIFGSALARELQVGFVPIRKPGKLPFHTIYSEYDLEYGTDKIEIHTDAIKPGQRVVVVDDLLATGGTMAAACDLVNRLHGQIVGISFLIELKFLEGRKKINGYDVHALIQY